MTLDEFKNTLSARAVPRVEPTLRALWHEASNTFTRALYSFRLWLRLANPVIEAVFLESLSPGAQEASAQTGLVCNFF